jgi:hypothetical protein
MPCQFCHSSSHTVSQCNHEGAIQQCLIVRDFMAANPIDLYRQYTNLNTLTRPALIVISSKLGLHCSGTKIVLIQRIIEYYFYKRFTNFLSAGPPVSQEEVQHAYARLMTWDPSDLYNFRHRMYQLLDQYYMRTFDVTSYHLYRIQAMIFANTLALVGAGAAVGATASKAHLKSLQIKININPDLPVQECFMCCEEKPIARLGCSHEYCADCVVGTAKVRTKSFITCAVCRAEVEEILVLNADLKTSISEQIKKE